jgi:hypothetical protein
MRRLLFLRAAARNHLTNLHCVGYIMITESHQGVLKVASALHLHKLRDSRVGALSLPERSSETAGQVGVVERRHDD